MNNSQQLSGIDLSKETSLIAYLDLANMFHWQDELNWMFSVRDIIKQIISIPNIKEVRVYFGENERNNKSLGFLKSLRKTGAIVKTKKVKWIKKVITKNLFVKQGTLELFEQEAYNKLEELIECLKKQGIAVIEEPKCNFDVEITLDMLDSIEKVSGVLLFSGDSDFKELLDRLKVKGKNIYVFGVRDMMSAELNEVATKCINFATWYTGHKKARIPPSTGGTA